MKRTQRTVQREGTLLDWRELRADAERVAEQVAPLIPRRPRVGELRRRGKSAATLICNVVENRRRMAKGNEAIRPLFYIWTMLNACNFACTYCDNHRGQKYPDLPNKGALDTTAGTDMLRIMRTGTSAIYFCGGEPTLRSDLPALTDKAYGLGYWPLMINTNGSRFHELLLRPEWARWLSQIDIVIVSLDAMNLDALAEMYVYARPQDIIQNILTLKALSARAGFKLFVNTVIQPGRIQDARDVLDFCRSTGVTFSCVPMNASANINEALGDDPEYVELAREIIDYAANGGRVVGGPTFLSRLLFSAPIRCLPTAFSHVSPEGRVLWPCKPVVNVDPVPVPILGKHSLDEVWDEGRAAIDPTGFQGSDPGQCGGDCNWLQHYVADAFVRMMQEPRKQRWVLQGLWRFLIRR